jgi:Domain of unknown function (DUF4388)
MAPGGHLLAHTTMSSSHAALIVDADPKGLEALVYGFQGADWRITACPTPETASLLVKATGAEIVVIASRSDHEKAHALIRQIRAKEAFRTLPVLVLGPEDLRKPLKESRDAELLPLPAFVRDVLTASQLLVEAGVAAAQKPGEEPSFAPPFAATTTLSLIRTLAGLARSGVLQLERKGRHGEIMFHEGELTAAQVGQLQGMAAVQHVLVWNEGTLKLHLRPVVRRGQLHQTAQEFLEDFDRFQRDYAHAMKDIGPPATVYATSEDRLQHLTNDVPAEVTPVVRLCDGQRTLSDIIDESPFRVLDTVRIVGRLVELAIFVRRNPKPGSDAVAPRAPLEEFLETARIVGPADPRASRAPGKGTELQSPPNTPPTAPNAPVISGNASAPAEKKGHARRKTLEIVTTTPGSPTPQPVTSTSEKGALPLVAAPTSDKPGAVTARFTVPTATEALPGANASHSVPAHSTQVPSPAPSTVQAPQPIATRSPFANLPVTGTMQGVGTSQTGVSISPFSPVPKLAVPGTQASGTIEPRERRTPSAMRDAPARTSVVLDIAQIETAHAPGAGAVPSPMVHGPAAQSPAVQAPVVTEPSGNSTARVTGEIQVAPSRKMARQMPAQTRMSIQLDVTLAPEPEKASAPVQATAVPTGAPDPIRLTGKMKTPPSGKNTRDAGRLERASSSFQIDPALAAETPAAASEPKRRPTGGHPVLSAAEKRQQSGNFSPIEKDFFEREAELYKDEGTESFADLDENRDKAGSKNGPGKKPGKPNRK